jgi:hypothetical protein
VRFPDRYGTGSGGIHDLLKPALEMAQSGDVLEPDVGEWRPVVPLRRREPAAAEPVVVVVVDEAGKRRLGLAEAAKSLTVEHFLLEHTPERLDLAVGPGLADLGPQMLDVELPQTLAERVSMPGIQTTKGRPLSLISWRG